MRPMTATPSTYGAKKTARKNVRPGNFRLSSTARTSGMATRNGTLATVKIAVARIECQNGTNCADEGLPGEQEVPVMQADPDAEECRHQDERHKQHEVGQQEYVRRNPGTVDTAEP